MEDHAPELQNHPTKPRRGKPVRIASNHLLVALNLVNEKMGQIRDAGFANYMNRDLPELRDSIVNTLKQRGEWEDE